MNGWEVVFVMIIATSALYLFVHMVDCFVKSMNCSKRTRIKW